MNPLDNLQAQLAAEKARADKAEAAFAEVRRRIENARDRLLRGDDDNALLKVLCEKDALSYDCGKGWLSPEVAAKVREALEYREDDGLAQEALALLDGKETK